MERIFENRVDAGRQLAKALTHYRNKANVIIFALPRGGVPVAYEIATALQLPLDVFLVRKLGVPWHEELAMGAIAIGGVQVFNQEIIDGLHLSPEAIQHSINEQEKILTQRDLLYRQNKPLPDLTDQTVILVDDGIATGATIRAAIVALRQLNCKYLVVAVPVAAAETYSKLKPLVDEFICLEIPESLYAIGYWYADFSQTTDEEVCSLLKKVKQNVARRNC